MCVIHICILDYICVCVHIIHALPDEERSELRYMYACMHACMHVCYLMERGAEFESLIVDTLGIKIHGPIPVRNQNAFNVIDWHRTAVNDGFGIFERSKCEPHALLHLSVDRVLVACSSSGVSNCTFVPVKQVN